MIVSHLLAVRTIKLSLCPQNRQGKFWYAVDGHIWMAFSDMVDEHTAPFEARLTVVTLENESLIVLWLNFWHKFGAGRWGLKLSISMHSLDMVNQL